MISDPKYATGVGLVLQAAAPFRVDTTADNMVAPDFADIFYSNAFKNGILLIKLPQAQVDQLMKDAEKGENARLTVDLERQVIVRPDGEEMAFDVEPFRKHCLMNGLDDISLTLAKADAISGFEKTNQTETPWLYR